MVAVHAQATVLPIAAKTFGEIKRGIIRNGCRVYLIRESPCLQQLLNSGELRDRERALQRIVAASVEKDDDGGLPRKNSLKVINSP